MQSINETELNYNRVSNRVGIIAGIAFITVVVLQSSIFTIGYDEVGLKARFGSLKEVLSPGLHFKLPFGIDEIEKVSASKFVVQEFGYRSADEKRPSEEELNNERSMITSDLNIVEISMAVHYQVADPVDYVSGIRETDAFVRSAAEAIVRELVGRSKSGSLYTTSGQSIGDTARPQLQSYLDSFNAGVAIKTVEIREISPPANVRPAFDRVNESRQEKERRVSEAQRVAQRKVAEARGRVAAIQANGEVEALKRTTYAHQQQTEFTALNAAYLKSPSIVKSGLYVDALKYVLPKMKSVLVTQGDNKAPISLLNMNMDEKK